MSHIVELYAVKDVKAGFMDPLSFESFGQAKRDFENFLKTIALSFHYVSPAELQLWHIGRYNLDTAVVTPLDIPTLVIDGASVVFMDEEVSNASPICDGSSD